jgi:DNA (cytosine-5)-methyltransferase 1
MFEQQGPIQVRGEGYVTLVPKSDSFARRRRQPQKGSKFVLDLFCGVGGFSAGFEQAKFFEVVAGVDLLGDRLETFSANHATANVYGKDIRKVLTKDIDDENPRPFVIVGGPPCQGFSSMRPFRNIQSSDPRNNLAEEFVRIVRDLRPEWIVFENVVGLLTYAEGKAYRAIGEAFESLGYRIDAKVLNAAHFGLPQRRERLIIVGSSRGKRFDWPRPTHEFECRSMVGDSELLLSPERGLFGKKLAPAITIDDAISDLPAVKSGESSSHYLGANSSSEYSKFIRNGATILRHHDATAHSEKMLEIIRLSGSSIRALPKGMVSSGFSSCYSRLTGAEPSVTLTVNFVHPSSNRCIHPTQDRALTPREGARLQGFFDTFEFKGSRAQIVKQIGNAVPPLLGRVIAESILRSD